MKHNYAIKGGNIDPGSGKEISGLFSKVLFYWTSYIDGIPAEFYRSVVKCLRT
jgi:hypothetical protein